jgi:uncharacterized protein
MSVPTAPKTPDMRKLLALDGGGIRGMITIEVLQQIENTLRAKFNKPELVLADYFDYIAGTSTGAIIATCLSLRMEVSKVAKFYRESGEQMFRKANIFNRLKYKYEDEPLAMMLKKIINDYSHGGPGTLGDPAIDTYLMMVLRNATTDSPWPVSNNPDAKYNLRTRKDCNLDIPLWQLVRASTAAPVYFPPEVVSLPLGNGDERTFIFVDGGITMYNNPAFQLFLMATTGPYKLNWPAGENKMLLISVGTGTAPAEDTSLRVGDMNLLYNASSIPSALMAAALHQQDLLCRVFGRCLAGDSIDREFGNFIEGHVENCGTEAPLQQKFFTYARYNAQLTSKGLTDLGLGNIKPQHVQQLDSIEHIDDLSAVGNAVGRQHVKSDHFNNFPA